MSLLEKRKEKPMTIVCDFRDLSVPHSEDIIHKEGVEDGLPCYEKQREGGVKISICSKCHGRVPGHIIKAVPNDIQEVLEIESLSELLNSLGSGHVGKGAKKEWTKRILERCVNCEHNPERGHA